MGFAEALMEEHVVDPRPRRRAPGPEPARLPHPDLARHARARVADRRGDRPRRARTAPRRPARGRCTRASRRSPTRSTTRSASAATACRSRPPRVLRRDRRRARAGGRPASCRRTSRRRRVTPEVRIDDAAAAALRGSSARDAVEGVVDGAAARPGARVVAGGTDILPNLKHRLDTPPVLVSLARVDGLRGVSRDDAAGVLRIGAGVTLTRARASTRTCGALSRASRRRPASWRAR